LRAVGGGGIDAAMNDRPPKTRRLAAALRENLKRRKAQARTRAAAGSHDPPGEAGGGPDHAGECDAPEPRGTQAHVGTAPVAAAEAADRVRPSDAAETAGCADIHVADDDKSVTWRVRLVAAELEAERIAALIERAVEADGLPVTRFELPDDAQGADAGSSRAARPSASVAVAAGAGAPAWSARLSGDAELPWAVEVLVFGGSAAAARARIADAVGGDGFGAAISVEPLGDENWVAKSLEGLAPVREGRFVVRGRHHRGEDSGAGIVLEIDAGLAFGTGHHATTVGCLAAIERALKRGRPLRALDLGTGTGVLAIALARLARIAVVATDVDPVAVRVARANAAGNGAGPWVRPFVADGMADRRLARGGFDLVVANILARPLERLAPAIGRALAPRATVVLSGLRVADGRRVEAAYRRQRLRIVRRDARDGWLTLTFKRRG
jgi:ribosomal protein L11 methyltransferase